MAWGAMKKVLINDIIIPAGTIFSDPPEKAIRAYLPGEALIALADGSYGSIVYATDGDSADEMFKNVEYFFHMSSKTNMP